MTFQQWYEKQFPNYKEHSATKDVAEAAWDEAFLEGLCFQNDRIIELNQTISNLRNLRMKYPERTTKDDL